MLPVSTAKDRWLRRALVASALLHVVIVGGGTYVAEDHRRPVIDVVDVDVEVAPAPPPVEALPEELAKTNPTPEPTPTPEPDMTPPPSEPGSVDAGIDASIDARIVDAAVPPDAVIDAPAMNVAIEDDAGVTPQDAASVAVVDDAPTVASVLGPPTTESTTQDAGTAPSDPGSGSGESIATANSPAVDGAPTTAGTAANLLDYFPRGHVVTVLVRLDRVRNTEWGPIAEKLLRPLPDYKLLFGDRDAHLVDQFETIVVSTPSPKDLIDTTIVARTKLTRPQLRKLLDQPATPVAWSTAKGGLLGNRSGALPQHDTRVFLSPFTGWFLLAQPQDLTGLLAKARGDLDRVEATTSLPAWLGSVKTIEKESGEPRGPALVVTLGFPPSRKMLPAGVDIALGVKSVPIPDRVSVAMELVPMGWLVRGNMRFTRESDAAELVKAIETAQQRIKDSKLLAMPLRQQHVYNAIVGLSVQQTGVRVSYSTSVSIADARTLLAALATAMTDYFASQQQQP